MNAILTAGALGLFASTAVCATDLPMQKPGLWETRMQYSADGKNVSAPASQRCMDEAALARAKLTSDQYIQKNCSKYAVRQEGGAWIIDMQCKAGVNTMVTHSVITYAGVDTYHSEVMVSYEPPSPGSRTVVDGKWLGACHVQ